MQPTYNQASILVRKFTANATLNLATEFGPTAQLVGFAAAPGAASTTLVRLLHPADNAPIAQLFCAANECRSHFGQSFNTAAFLASLTATGIVGAFASPLPVSTRTSLLSDASAADSAYRLDIVLTGVAGVAYVYYTK